MNDQTDQNWVRPNPEASAKSTEASAEASAESLAIKKSISLVNGAFFLYWTKIALSSKYYVYFNYLIICY